MARSLSNLLIVLVKDPSEYIGKKPNSTLGCHIPAGNPKNFDEKGRDIILLKTSPNPGFFSYLINKEVGHFILQDTTEKEMKDIFNITKDNTPSYMTPQERMVLQNWNIFLAAPSLLTQKQQDFFAKKVEGVGGGTPEITHELLLKKKGQLK